MPFLIGGAIAAGVGLLGAGGAAAGGIGRNGTSVTNFGDTSQYNPNAFNYGGWSGGANEAASRYAGQAAGAQYRGAAQADYGQANNYGGLANAWNDQSFQARQAQGNVAGLMYNRATGAVPSIAGQQAAADQAALQRQAAEQSRSAQAQQMAAAASARGPAGLALAQQGAANNIANSNGAIGAASANAMQGISQQAQVNAAQERMQAEQGAMGAYSGMRQGDQSSQGLAQGMQGQLAQQAQYQAGLQQQQHGLNDAMTLGMTGYETGVQGANLAAQQNQQGILSGSFGQAQGLRADVNQNNANNAWKYVNMGLGAAQGGLGMGMQGVAPPVPKAHGGPVSAGRPYLVGERGPELIVPQHDGYVIPNHALGLAHREEGGPLVAGQPTVVGEAGPEAVMVAPPGPHPLPPPPLPPAREQLPATVSGRSVTRNGRRREAPGLVLEPPAERPAVMDESAPAIATTLPPKAPPIVVVHEPQGLRAAATTAERAKKKPLPAPTPEQPKSRADRLDEIGYGLMHHPATVLMGPGLPAAGLAITGANAWARALFGEDRPKRAK